MARHGGHQCRGHHSSSRGHPLCGQRQLGHVKPPGHRSGAKRRLDDQTVEAARLAVVAQPDLTLEELRLRRRPGVRVSVPTLCRVSVALDLPRKKQTFVAREADAAKRRAFRERMAGLAAGRRLIFLDKKGCNLNLARRYGRVPKGVRLVDKNVPRNTPPNRSLISALGLEGILTSMEIEGAIGGDAFLVFLQHFFGPCLRPGDVVLKDNLSTHRSTRLREARRRTGRASRPWGASSGMGLTRWRWTERE